MARINTNAGLQMGLQFSQSLQDNLARAQHQKANLRALDSRIKRNEFLNARTQQETELAQLEKDTFELRLGLALAKDNREQQRLGAELQVKDALRQRYIAEADETVADTAARRAQTANTFRGRKPYEYTSDVMRLAKAFRESSTKFTPAMEAQVRGMTPAGPEQDRLVTLTRDYVQGNRSVQDLINESFGDAFGFLDPSSRAMVALAKVLKPLQRNPVDVLVGTLVAGEEGLGDLVDHPDYFNVAMGKLTESLKELRELKGVEGKKKQRKSPFSAPDVDVNGKLFEYRDGKTGEMIRVPARELNDLVTQYAQGSGISYEEALRKLKKDGRIDASFKGTPGGSF